MILYHGSNIDVIHIDLSLSKTGKDFGCGFYLSADKEQALALAKRKTEQIGTGNPVLNVYEFDETNLQSADLSVLHFQTLSEKTRNPMAKETFMIEELSKEIVLLLMEEHGMDLKEALRTLYTSDTYAKLTNLRTGLFSQSTAYVYEYLEHELATGKMA